MTYTNKRNEFRPASGEAPFSLDEVFFSRTDERGIILAGNYVFRRVAFFDWPDLLGAPHRIIRHPDMPRGVFWLLWQRIREGRIMGAYVKNLARDGLYYWVYAVVSPIAGGGYLSARIKPSSSLFGMIEKEYAALLAAEQAEHLTPEASAMRLLARLAELGFSDYDRFAAYSLSEELSSRDALLGRAPDPRVEVFRQMQAAAQAMRAETDALIDEFERMRTVPHNMRVIASRLEPTGGPVSTLSKNYGAISLEMSDWFANNVAGDTSNFAAILGSVFRSMFVEGTSRILQECDEQIGSERRRLGDVNLETERLILSDQMRHYESQSALGVTQLREEASRILAACNTMNRHVLGLSSTRVLCKIESARLPSAGAGLADIITQLGIFQERITSRLEQIAEHATRILTLVP